VPTWIPGPLRRARIRSTALRLYREGGVERVFRWLDESGGTVDELRHAFRRDALALRIIEDHVNPPPVAPAPVAGGSAFERAVDDYLAAICSAANSSPTCWRGSRATARSPAPGCWTTAAERAGSW
jgi:hypothetical protein